MKKLAPLGCALILQGCATPFGLPASPGEQASGAGYVPLDPLPVQTIKSEGTCTDWRKPATDPAGEEPAPAQDHPSVHGAVLAAHKLAVKAKTPATADDNVPKPFTSTYPYVPLPQALPDISERFAIADYGADGTLTFGHTKLTAKNEWYRAVMDYISADEIAAMFYIRRTVTYIDPKTQLPYTYTAPDTNVATANSRHSNLLDPTPIGAINSYEARIVPIDQADPELFYNSDEVSATMEKDSEKRLMKMQVANQNISRANSDRLRTIAGILSVDGIQIPQDASPNQATKALRDAGWHFVAVPIYVGFGARLTADVRILDASADISSLPALAFSASAHRIVGSIAVQIMGMNTASTGLAVPLSNTIDQGSIQNAMLALGNTRSEFYHLADPSSKAYPSIRIVGLDSPVGTDPRLINAIYAQLPLMRLPWRRPCIEIGFNAPPYASAPADSDKPTAPEVMAKATDTPKLAQPAKNVKPAKKKAKPARKPAASPKKPHVP